eukprot:TRINITY_DN668_c0_g2_i2.p1 TRINITY_DN668_c0_g2~~TRINITY_DN668_c0_g2_i2.p1  ORF type:complete len:350 (-),score=55.70 TRINITY_DN668_c0_g2_i2:347-1396(-)
MCIRDSFNTFKMKTLELKGHERPVNAIKLNFDGDLFFSGGSDSLINVWSVKTGERLGSYKQTGSIRCLDIDDDSKYLITGTQIGYIHIFEVKTGKLLKKIEDEKVKIKFLELSYGSKDLLLLLESYDQNFTNQIYVYQDFWKVMDNKDQVEVQLQSIVPKLVINGSPYKMNQVKWGFLNKSYFACTETGEILKYDDQGKCQNKVQVHTGEIKQISFSKDFSLLATAGNDGCKFLDPENLQVIRFIKQQLPMNTVAISPMISLQQDEKEQRYHCLMAGGIPSRESAKIKIGGYEVRLCNIMFGQEIANVQLHFGPCNVVCFLNDGRGFISGGEDGYCKLFRFDSSYWEYE